MHNAVKFQNIRSHTESNLEPHIILRLLTTRLHTLSQFVEPRAPAPSRPPPQQAAELAPRPGAAGRLLVGRPPFVGRANCWTLLPERAGARPLRPPPPALRSSPRRWLARARRVRVTCASPPFLALRSFLQRTDRGKIGKTARRTPRIRTQNSLSTFHQTKGNLSQGIYRVSVFLKWRRGMAAIGAFQSRANSKPQG